MLVVSRRVGERVFVGENITVTVVATTGGRVRIGIEAPTQVAVLREELVEEPTAAHRNDELSAEARGSREGPLMRRRRT